ncbi:hypothetical protein [Nannocystis radixulma]|uniref:Lipoprotein n=1 Tax=Nannocystis radixulma TaxID=2995305 RepID=A0ABT5AZ49_9BACT|nr:hypothetical protein [Nannocystis radixulma]MDC0666503.1 hypothetical protein [Nannocystis radixulma]
MRSSHVLLVLGSLAALAGCGERGARGNVDTSTGGAPAAVEANPPQVDDTAGALPEEVTGVDAVPEGAGQVEAQEDDAPAPAPESAEEAAQQFAAWLTDRTAPVPALLTATSAIEVAMHCDGCDRAAPVKTVTVVGIDAMSAVERELRAEVVLGMWDFGDQLDCKDGCCRFLIDPELGQSEHVMGLKRVCVATDPHGKPTAYTRVEGVGAWPKSAKG